ncbi:MAG: DUF378 domain-containing protein [Candidatus Moranbacteria bacterium]|nr:DUF378 domain-containing protein [Candidatus Moranbacteria bacterium]
MKGLSSLDWLAIALVIVGGLNWGLVGAFDFDLVETVFGGFNVLSRIIYVVVGLAAVYLAFLSPALAKK